MRLPAPALASLRLSSQTCHLLACRLPEALVPAIIARLSLRDVDALRRTCRASRRGVYHAQDNLRLLAQVCLRATRSAKGSSGAFDMNHPLQELLDDGSSAYRPGLTAQQLAMLAPTGSSIQDQLDALARLNERIKLGKPALTEHFHMGPNPAVKDSHKQRLHVYRCRASAVQAAQHGMALPARR